MNSRLISSLMILLMFFITMTWVPSIIMSNAAKLDNVIDSPLSQIQEDSDTRLIEDIPFTKIESYDVSNVGPLNGILNPVIIEQVGYTSSGTLLARTDNGMNTHYSLPLDDIHAWVGNQVDLNVRNLTKLFALNGTFTDGTSSGETFYPDGIADYYPYGWGAISTTGSSDPEVIQRVAYEATGRDYVVVEAKAKLTNNPQHVYTHYSGTTVYWNQSIDIIPATSDFILSFCYLYQNGPIDGTGPNSFSGNAYIEVIVDNFVVFSISLKDITQRNNWFDTGQIPISLTPSQNPTMLKIGINLNSTFSLDADNDYDYTPGADGTSNAEYITVLFDDVSLIAGTPPSFEQVDLQFNIEGISESITGSSGTGSASIFKSDYWTVDPVNIQVTSNTTVLIEYEAILQTHRFSNSTWVTDNTKEGVYYSASTGTSPQLLFHTYIGFLGDYINLTTRAWFPSDWANVTVFDPFLSDVTLNCVIAGNMVEISTSMMNRLGWWKFILESPNYAKSIDIQKYNYLTETWGDESIYRSGNRTRALIAIGTLTEIPNPLGPVNITWFQPNSSIWAMEIVTNGVAGQVASTPYTIGPFNSTAGLWSVCIAWNNGTEIGYDTVHFEVHHAAQLVSDPSEITTDTGLIIKGLVRYTDFDTGVYLLDSSATLIANWSGSVISLAPNPVQNWWEANFDTAITGAGTFVINVNASRPFYDDATCQIVVQSTIVTRLTSPNAPWTSEEWGHTSALMFNYELYNYETKTWGPIINDTPISVSINWTAGYWSVENSTTPGIYIIYLDTRTKNTGTWLLNATFSKFNHESKIVLLSLIVTPVTSSLSIFGEDFAQVELGEEQFLKLAYLNSGGFPIASADVVIDRISPSSGLSYTDFVEVSGEPGNYSTSLTPSTSGVFTIRFVATKLNAEPAAAVFVIVVNEKETELDIVGSSIVEIGLTDFYDAAVRFTMLNGTGISNAQINITYSGGIVGALSWEISEIGDGDYSVEFNSTASGTYLITIAAFKQYYQSDSDAFFLVVREITTHLNSLNGTAATVGFGKNYRLFVNYTSNSGVGLSGANVTIANVVPAIGLIWENTLPESEGLYSILLTPLESNTFTVLVQANLFNHQTQFVLFTLTATVIATSLTVLNASTTISLDRTFRACFLFHDEDLAGLDNANLTVQNSPAGVSFSEFAMLGNGYYCVTITPLQVGTFDVIFKASKNGYQTGYASFTLGAVRIPTDLHIGSGLSSDSVMFSELYDLLIFYDRTDTGVNVMGATIDLHASPDIGISWSYIEVDNGYRITIETTHIGRWTLTITAQKTSHASGSIEFILDANPIPIHVELLSGTLIEEGTLYYLSVRLTQQDTSIPVTNATLTYRISTSRAGEFLEMSETTTEGFYAAQFSLPLYSDTTEYWLEITIDKDNFEYSQSVFEQHFTKTINIAIRMTPIVFGGSGIGAAIFVLLVGIRISSRRKKLELDRDLDIKRRFDDADNIIGVIVLHKKSGLPVYTKMMKGGFEEGIVAAFITAVTHFREEFTVVDEGSMTVMPISDIIRAVQTRNLICAVITVKSASIEHNRNMEEYARQVASFLDDLFDEKPSSFVDFTIVNMLDHIFNTTMDGFFLQYYKVATSEKFPKRYQLLDDILHDTDTRHCTKPVLLAKSLSSYGVSEARGCTLVLEAIEKELIVLCEGDETESPEIDFTEFFSTPDRDGSVET